MGRKRKLEINSNLANTNELSNSSGNSSSHHSSLSMIQRSAANDRERTRMRVLSKAFVRLKTSLPWVPADTKLSKLDTLKLATSYISYLTHILQDDENKLSNLNANEIFQTTNSSFQKFNLNTKMFSNIRFSHTDKHKKIIENLKATNSIPPIGSFSNSLNMKINSSNSQNEYVSILLFFCSSISIVLIIKSKIFKCWDFNSSNKNSTAAQHQQQHQQQYLSTTNSSPSTLSKQMYFKDELMSPCYSSNGNFTSYYNQTYS